MSSVMAADRRATPDHIGRYLVEGEATFLECTRAELDRGAAAVAQVVAGFALAPGRYVLMISLTQEIAQFAPFEQACTQLGLIGTNADASVFDVARVEAICRQFDPGAVLGIDLAMLDALEALGHDPEAVFAGRVLWARSDAWERVATYSGVIARRCAEVGPLLAIECVAGEGLHFDGREWAAEAPAGTIVLSSRLKRVQTIEALDTRIRGRVESMPCRCGSEGPRLVIEG